MSIKAWIIDDDDSIRWVLSRALKNADIQARDFPLASECLDALHDASQSDFPDVLISDVRMPGIDGMQLLQRVQREYPQLPVIIMTAHSDLQAAVSSYEGGAFEYLPKPFDIDEAIELVTRAAKANDSKSHIDSPVEVAQSKIIGEAPAMQEVFRVIGRLSRSNITVMITGESGTGKELVASALHEHSPRASKPFIAINTAAIPKDLLESELFGHERGAFTGAQAQRKGRFEQADGGTLFLDEIGDMPADLQTRLLRVLADGEFYRVGGHSPIKVDVRILAATHQNLEQRVRQGLFREDLFHRLNVIRVQLPALRERADDIPLLLNFFLGRVATELEVEAKVLNPEVEAFLSTLLWRGNVRQLENTCRWLTVMGAGREIHLDDLPLEIKQPSEPLTAQAVNPVGAAVTLAPATSVATAGPSGEWDQMLREWARGQLSNGVEDLLDEAMPKFEKVMIEIALEITRGHKQEAAKLLGWGRNTLTRKIKQLELPY
jgi:two-component system nitrogen regulation response regulator GlnG